MNDLDIVGIGPGHRLLRRRRFLEASIPGAGEGANRDEYLAAVTRATAAKPARGPQGTDSEGEGAQ